MKNILLFEKFTEDQYKQRKEEEESNIIQILGDEFIIDIVADGDFHGLNYLLNTGYNLQECGASEHLLAVAINNNQTKMFDYLTKNYADINTMSLPEITRDKYNYNYNLPVTPELIEKLKFITNKGYDFFDGYNQFKLYLIDTKNNRVLNKQFYPFIEWYLEKHPENYKYIKDLIEDEEFRKKYKYLENSDKYNL